MKTAVVLSALSALALARVIPRAADFQTFTQALGGIAATPVTDSGNTDRPFAVKGDTFVNLAAALQRSCDQQFNACANSANGGNKALSVSACSQQQTECNAAASSNNGNAATAAASTTSATAAAAAVNPCDTAVAAAATSSAAAESATTVAAAVNPCDTAVTAATQTAAAVAAAVTGMANNNAAATVTVTTTVNPCETELAAATATPTATVNPCDQVVKREGGNKAKAFRS